MTRPVSAFELLGRHLRESSNSIETIANLVAEDQMRRDTDDETPFLSAGDTSQLMEAIRQLSDRVSGLTDELVELGSQSQSQSQHTARGGTP